LKKKQDYVRSGLVSQDNPDIWVTGSYDQTVKIWDTRMKQSVMTLNHSSPVESLLMFPGGSLIVSAGNFFFFLKLKTKKNKTKNNHLYLN